jgi:type I restriction enzyme, S subunit
MSAGLRPYADYRESNVPWIGRIPAHWDMARLKQVSSRSALYGANISASAYVADGVRFLRTTDITDDGALRPGGVHVPEELAGDYMLKDNDLLISRSGTVGRSFLYNEDSHGPCSYAGYLVRFELGPKVVPEFVFYFTKTIAFADFLKISAIQSTIDNVNGEKYANSPLPLPPIDEQEAITRFVSNSDRQISRLIRNKRRLIALLNEEKQAIIQQAVTRGLDPNVPMNPSGVEWLGEVPAHWSVRRMSTFSPKISNGWVGPTRDILREFGTPYIQSLHVKSGSIRFKRKYFVEDQWLSLHPKARLRKDDVVIVQTGDIGQVACIPDKFHGAGCHALIIVRTDPEIVIGPFLDLVLRSRYGFESLRSLQTGALHPHLNCTWVREIPIQVPPLAEQRAIVAECAAAVSEVERVVETAEKEIDLIREYRTRLIADVVTGQLDVREAAASLPDIEDEEGDSLLTDADDLEEDADLPDEDLDLIENADAAD